MSKPTRIVPIRHGNSAANADKRVQADTPDHRIPLTPAGHEPARAAGAAGAAMLNLFGEQEIAVYLSPYARTRHVATHRLQSRHDEVVVRGATCAVRS
jgi:broad specificity phosphatase PhoE